MTATRIHPGRLEVIADDLDALAAGAGPAAALPASEAAELLRRLAAGDLEVERCRCETLGPLDCPTCSAALVGRPGWPA